MALPKIEPTYEKPKFGSTAYTAPEGINPETLRLLAQRRAKQGMVAPVTAPGQRQPQQSTILASKSAPLDPRLRAAMALRLKMKKQLEQQRAPMPGRPV